MIENMYPIVKLVLSVFSFIPFEIGVTGFFYSLLNNYVYLPNKNGKYYKEMVPFLPRLYLFVSSIVSIVIGLLMIYPLANTIGII
jgi:hypothetical protein